MSIRNFLIELKKQKKLELVEPSEDIMKSYIEKSESNLESAKILFGNNKFEESIYLTYYSMYNMLKGLLFRVGIKCENHSASITLLKKIFNLDNSDIHFAKKERVDKQYYTDFNLVKKDISDLIRRTENFNNIIFNFISHLNVQKINLYRKAVKEI